MAFDFVDRQGFAHTVGSMSTAPLNDAAAHDLAPKMEEYSHARGAWVTASRATVRMIAKMPEAKRAQFLRLNAAIYRVAPAAETIVPGDDGDYYAVPRGYGREMAVKKLHKMTNKGFIVLGGRQLKIVGRHSSPPQHNGDAGTLVYILRHAGGTTRFTREALIDMIERGQL